METRYPGAAGALARRRHAAGTWPTMALTFSTDAKWPTGLLEHFRGLEGEGTVESRYYGPYNFLLNYVTDYSVNYEVAPQTSIVRLGNDSVDFVMWYVVRDRNRKVLMFVEVKDDRWFERPSTRLAADTQMRERFESLGGGEPLNPRVYGVCALGTRIAVYTLDTASGLVTPPTRRRPDPDRVLPGDFIHDLWNVDLLSQGGFDEMKRVMGDIRRMSP